MYLFSLKNDKIPLRTNNNNKRIGGYFLEFIGIFLFLFFNFSFLKILLGFLFFYITKKCIAISK